MKVYSVCNTQRVRKDGSMAVYIVVYRSGMPRLRINTGLLCKLAPVDGVFPRREQNHSAKTKYLMDMTDKIEVLVLENSLLGNDELKAKILSVLSSDSSDSNMRIADCIDLFVKDTGKSGNSRAVFMVTKSSIMSYDADATIDIDEKWADGYAEFLDGRVKPNTKATRIANIKTVMNWAVRRGMIKSNPFCGIRVKRVATRKRNLCVDSLRAIRDKELSGKPAEYRDMLMLMFYLIGVNAKDLFTAKRSQVHNGRFEYNRAKTGKFYSIKIEPEARELLDRYAGKDLLLRVCEGRNYSNYNACMAHTLNKMLGGITSYYSRHTWASLAAEVGIPIETISNALGHSHGEKVTLVYVNYSQSKVDEANRKVIDYVNGV